MLTRISLFLSVVLPLFIASCSTAAKPKTRRKRPPMLPCRRIRQSPSRSSIRSIRMSSCQARDSAPGFPNPSSWMVTPCFAGGAEAKGILNKIVQSGRLTTPPNCTLP